MKNLEKKSYLKKLELKEYRSFKDLSIDFVESNVIVILGINGIGKSSILDAISYNLSFFTAKMFAINQEEIVCDSQPEFDDVNVDAELALCTLTFYSLGNEISISTSLGISMTNPKYTYEPKEFIDNLRSLISTNKEVGLPTFAYYRSHRSKVDSDHSNFKGTYDSRLYGIHKAFRMEFSSFTGFESWYSAVNENAVGGSENSTLEHVNKALLTFLSTFLQEEFTEVRVVKARVTNGFLYDNFRIQILKTNQWINLRSLSSGEKSLIFLVCDIARRLSISNNYNSTSLEGDGVVLIDEIELHLHPTWQRNILSSLSKVFPNIQFIVTTHSPIVLSTLEDKAIYTVDNSSYFTTALDPKGRDVNSILEEIMDVPSRPIDLDKKIKRLQKILALEKKVTFEAEILFNEILNYTSQDDPIVGQLRNKMILLQ
jgi:predicted ATP-binding protein involved in virulence